jgi:hypothetical protein
VIDKIVVIPAPVLRNGFAMEVGKASFWIPDKPFGLSGMTA